MSAEQVADFLISLGIEPGEGVLLALADGDVLREAIEAVALIGAIAVPDTDDPATLIGGGQVRHVIAHAADTTWFNGVAGNCTRIAVGPKTPGWAAYP